VVGERPNCPFRNQIQLAAYAYDDGNIPYQNASLLKQFDTTLEVRAACCVLRAACAVACACAVMRVRVRFLRE
jgi:hypothetical protein